VTTTESIPYHLGPLSRLEARALPPNLKAERDAHLQRLQRRRAKARLKAADPERYFAQRRKESRAHYARNVEAERARSMRTYYGNREVILARCKRHYAASRAQAALKKAAGALGQSPAETLRRLEETLRAALDRVIALQKFNGLSIPTETPAVH
jgi:hypothetical protein